MVYLNVFEADLRDFPSFRRQSNKAYRFSVLLQQFRNRLSVAIRQGKAEQRSHCRPFIDQLPAGQYFLSVTAQTADGRSQIAYETYSTEVKTTLHGVLCFYVLPDGSVHASYFNEGE